jgi:hypothetical protein
MSMPPKIGLAFEYFEDDEQPPQKLYRVRWTRTFNHGRKLRCSDYFIDEIAAWKFAGDKTEAGHEVNGVETYEMNGENK